MQSRRLLVVALGISLTLIAAPSNGVAADSVTIDSEIPGTLELSASGAVQERITVPAAVLTALAAVSVGSSVTIEAWPVAPGQRRRIALTRHVVVDSSAQSLLVTPDAVIPLPASSRAHLWGADGAGTRVMLSLDAASGDLHGFTVSGGEVFELLRDGADHLVLSAAERAAAEGWPLQPWTCSNDDSDVDTLGKIVGDELPLASELPESSSHTATIAFDTDTELMQLKFSNNQTAALDYIADLVAAMNVMYERDLDVTLLQGDTILRIGTDPYTQNSGGAASSAELNEFSSYWSSHYNSIDRALAAMLSGKSTSPSSASGIAWVGGLCSHSYGYSFTKVFRNDYLAGDAFVVGHELGHNFGSRHTHCYTPPIDECYSGEGGCYQGPTSCPGGPGTVMSYCHLAGCGSNLMQFHSRVITNILNNYVAPAIGVCIFESGGGNPLFADGFESGDTSAWSATGP